MLGEVLFPAFSLVARRLVPSCCSTASGRWHVLQTAAFLCTLNVQPGGSCLLSVYRPTRSLCDRHWYLAAPDVLQWCSCRFTCFAQIHCFNKKAGPDALPLIAAAAGVLPPGEHLAEAQPVHLCCLLQGCKLLVQVRFPCGRTLTRHSLCIHRSVTWPPTLIWHRVWPRRFQPLYRCALCSRAAPERGNVPCTASSCCPCCLFAD